MSVEPRAKTTELIGLAPARGAAYAFLSRAFAEPPSAEQLAVLRSDAFLQGAAGWTGARALNALRAFAESAETETDLQRVVRQDFMNLFRVPGGQYVTPYESVFRDTREVGGKQVKGLLMGPSAVDVQRWYRLAALEISDDYKDLPDHIGLELHYLAHLCSKEQAFVSAGDDAKLTRTWEMERDFLAAHVASWIGMLRDRIHAKAQHAYYRAVADLAVDFVGRDLATLEGVLGKGCVDSGGGAVGAGE